MSLTRRSLLLGTAGLAAFAAPLRAQGAAEAARQFIADLGRDAVAILQASEPQPAKATRLEDLFRRGFDFEAIGRFVLGRFWTSATPVQRRDYLAAFTDFVTYSYAQRLAGEIVTGFNIASIRDLGEGDFLVQTGITRPTGAPLNYEWRVRQSPAGMKITDVIVEGVSLLTTQRADFTSVAQREGIDGLIQALRQKSGR